MPKPLNSPEEVYNTLKELNFRENNEYLPWSDPIWQQASEAFRDKPMKKDYLWQYIRNDRNGVSSRIHNKSLSKSSTKRTKVESDLNWSTKTLSSNLEPLRATIELKLNEWCYVQRVITGTLHRL